MKSLRDKIAVVGIGETDYVRKTERRPKELVIEAVKSAIDDANLRASDIDGIVGGYTGMQFMNHSDMAHDLGIKYRFHGNMGDGGGSNTSSFHLAAMAITSGMADFVLAYCTTTYGSLMRVLDNILEGKVQEGICEAKGSTALRGSFESPYGSNMPGIFFAQMAQRYAYEYGLTREKLMRALGSIAVNQRHNALLNGKGVMKKSLTYEDYINSPFLADPLKRDDYYAVTDGACAWIITSADRAKNCAEVPVYVSGMGYGFTPMGIADGLTQKSGGYLYRPHESRSLDQALRMAEVTREDLDFAEIYDSYTIQLLLALESLGFCKKGEGGAFAESGAISLGGALPVNTHGGHLSHSCLHGATHVIEAIHQLRGEAGACQVNDAKIGMVSAGIMYENYVAILRRD